MGTHPIFESDFDCLTEMHRSLPRRGTIQQVKPHVKGINFPTRTPWTPSIPKTGPQIPAHIVALAAAKPKSKMAKTKPVEVATTMTTTTCPRGRKPRFVDI